MHDEELRQWLEGYITKHPHHWKLRRAAAFVAQPAPISGRRVSGGFFELLADRRQLDGVGLLPRITGAQIEGYAIGTAPGRVTLAELESTTASALSLQCTQRDFSFCRKRPAPHAADDRTSRRLVALFPRTFRRAGNKARHRTARAGTLSGDSARALRRSSARANGHRAGNLACHGAESDFAAAGGKRDSPQRGARNPACLRHDSRGQRARAAALANQRRRLRIACA